ncbi:uncharacterized protein LOC119668618 [Teleopsis dalmanni]|uniref:uncharacterized protein LOC119667726 n=1 Tax=Teleopsis dalmanni TaxID=139649 RepID=UPI0018CCD58F|nr:uncharacterized protein LOC119667726 [Teleopsis dalmanni]XP_037932970.1 uncharacterized protein LOC119667726 [Teleopsis dalmanni]XP_037934117.1 uncharacterized protein LOC119668618 [Teleopsis dalmanni]XP_037934126.1 uncharacterized protein LOC119668618 [Teleopsis dalmanni]
MNSKLRRFQNESVTRAYNQNVLDKNWFEQRYADKPNPKGIVPGITEENSYINDFKTTHREHFRPFELPEKIDEYENFKLKKRIRTYKQCGSSTSICNIASDHDLRNSSSNQNMCYQPSRVDSVEKLFK